jgi:hypothetical protein
MATGKKGRTIWEMLTQGESVRPEAPKPQIYNPLAAKAGSLITVHTAEFATQQQPLTVETVSEVRRSIGSQTFYFSDYPLAGAPKKLKLRVSAPSGMKAVPDHVVVLHLHDEMAYDKAKEINFEGVLNNDAGDFRIDDEDGTPPADYLRINDVRRPYEATVLNLDGSTRQVTYWDYWRTTKDEAGNEVTEFLFVERDDDNGWFQLWRGTDVPPEVVTVLL